MSHQEKIVDRCPACGTRSLFIGEGGYLTCSLIDCKNPATGDAIEDLQHDLAEAREVLRDLIQATSDNDAALDWSELDPDNGGFGPHPALVAARILLARTQHDAPSGPTATTPAYLNDGPGPPATPKEAA